MELQVLPDSGAVAQRAAGLIADFARKRVGLTGRFALALSGGSTPWKMLQLLADADLPWEALAVFQVDERVASAAGGQRNLTRIEESLLGPAPLNRGQIRAMPVEQSDLPAAAGDYARTLLAVCGQPPILDLVQLGLGEDGHTASLVPSDPALENKEPVAITGPYNGLQRMTLTYPTLNRARRRLWIVTGAHKRAMLNRLYHGDRQIPAGRVETQHTLILADRDAAEGLER